MDVLNIMQAIVDIRLNVEAASEACLHANCAKAFDLLEEVQNQLFDLFLMLPVEE